MIDKNASVLENLINLKKSVSNKNHHSHIIKIEKNTEEDIELPKYKKLK
jgi:hypothetical protein